MDFTLCLIFAGFVLCGVIIAAPIAFQFGKHTEQQYVRDLLAYISELEKPRNRYASIVLTPRVGANAANKRQR